MKTLKLNNKLELTGLETKREARTILRNIKGLNGYDIVAITWNDKNMINFNCYNMKTNKAYYGLLDNIDLIISLDYAGDVDDMI